MALIDSLKGINILELYQSVWWLVDFIILSVILTEVAKFALKDRFGRENKVAKTLGFAFALSLFLVMAQYGADQILSIKVRLLGTFAGLILAFLFFFISKSLLATIMPNRPQ